MRPKREFRDRDDRGPRDRNDRGPRGDREDRPRRERRDVGDMQLYRIEVGRDDGVEVRHIVGAIANEGDISSRYIGNIKLFASHPPSNCRKVCRVKCCNTLRVLAFSTSR